MKQLSAWSFFLLGNVFGFLAWFIAWHAIEHAWAYRPGGQFNSFFTTNAVTVGAGSAQALAADPKRSSLSICNQSGSNNIAWSWGQFGPAALNAAGSHMLSPGQCVFFDNTKATDAINMIASGPGTPATIDVVD